MANFQGQLSIASGYQRHGIYTWTNGGGAGAYFHFKTNAALSTYIMSRVEAIGVNYAAAYPIRCAWVWYSAYYLANAASESVYSGLTANGVYLSSDNYVCFRAYASVNNDVSFILNAIHANPSGVGPGYNLAITAASQNSTSGNYY
jgi:hypothetical protein